MNGLKCPVCDAISLVKLIDDGEIFDCPFCKAKFTVTAIRRFYLQPEGEMGNDNYESFVQHLSLTKLLNLLIIISTEVAQRHKNNNK